MERTFEIAVDAAACIRCGRCAAVCPSLIFRRERPDGGIAVCEPANCIGCGHCAAVCPAGAVRHSAFPAGRIHAMDRHALPTPEQFELLAASRRSMRNFTERPVPERTLDRIVAAADRAPTATNARALGYAVVTDPARLRAVTEFTLGTFGRIVRLLSHPLVRPWLRPAMPGAYRYVPVFERMQREYAGQGIDRILRGATALLVIHAPKGSRFGAEDANLACQNASLAAEALGVGQVYMGFVLTASRQRKGVLERMLELGPDRRIRAVLALGMPRFRYPNYIDRESPSVKKL